MWTETWTEGQGMAQTGKLNARKVSTAGLGKHGDGGGLWLVVRENGSRAWVFRYTRDGRSYEMGLGAVSSVPLAKARDKAAGQREMLADGVDPIRARDADRGKYHRTLTFKQAYALYIGTHGKTWRNDKHRRQWESTLAAYAAPVIGDMPISRVNTAAVMRVLEPVWHAKPETASRLRQRIERIIDWAKVRGDFHGENPARWKGHLDQLLPAKTKVQRVKHHRAMPWTKLPPFMADLRRREGVAARALEFAILTAARSGEVRGMTWGEVDLEAKAWTIPAERMKAQKEHRVPLSDRAVAILYDVRPLSGGLVFEGQRKGKPLSDMSLTAVLKRMGRGVTVHGFRSTFRDWAAESTGYPREVAEMALAHAVASAVEAAYRRGDLFAKRRRLMNEWAKYCARPPAESKGKVRALRA